MQIDEIEFLCLLHTIVKKKVVRAFREMNEDDK